jgi:hypothetical protein
MSTKRIKTSKAMICGREYTIKYNPNEGGGSFSASKRLITVGTIHKSEAPFILMHEIVECILAERCLRYSTNCYGDNGDYMFCFNHAQFEQIIPDIVYALKTVKIDKDLV